MDCYRGGHRYGLKKVDNFEIDTATNIMYIACLMPNAVFSADLTSGAVTQMTADAKGVQTADVMIVDDYLYTAGFGMYRIKVSEIGTATPEMLYSYGLPMSDGQNYPFFHGQLSHDDKYIYHTGGTLGDSMIVFDRADPTKVVHSNTPFTTAGVKYGIQALGDGTVALAVHSSNGGEIVILGDLMKDAITVTPLASNLGAPTGLALSEDGTELYVTDSGSISTGRVLAVSVADGTVRELLTKVDRPTGICTSNNGRVAVFRCPVRPRGNRTRRIHPVPKR